MTTENKLFVNHTFNCSATELFDWLIDPMLITKWFGPEHLRVTDVKTDVHVDGEYSIELQKPDQQIFFIKGKYIELNKPHGLTFSLYYEGLPTSPPESVVTIRLEEKSETESKLYLTQSFEYTPSDMANRTKAWNHMLQVLGEQLETA